MYEYEYIMYCISSLRYVWGMPVDFLPVSLGSLHYLYHTCLTQESVILALSLRLSYFRQLLIEMHHIKTCIV